MEIKAKLLLLAALMVGTVSVVAQKAPVTGSTCHIELAATQCNTDEPPCPRSLGLSSYKPAKSCREIFRCNPSSPSGYYWLKSASMECREVYCDMDTTRCNIRGGWMRMAYLNMTEPGASCPTSLRQINTPAKLCGRRTAPGCSSVTYPVDGIRYSKVCGQARGYQYHTTDAFQPSTNEHQLPLCRWCLHHIWEPSSTYLDIWSFRVRGWQEQWTILLPMRQVPWCQSPQLCWSGLFL